MFASYADARCSEILLTTKVKLVDDLTIKANQALDDGKSMEAMEYGEIVRRVSNHSQPPCLRFQDVLRHSANGHGGSQRSHQARLDVPIIWFVFVYN